MFTNNPELSAITLVLAMMLLLAIAGLVAFFATNKESNKIKYPGNAKKFKFSDKGNEPQVNEFLDVFAEKKLAK
jgi:hypothetical protein